MTGSPSSILMVGFGNGTFAGSPSLIMTLGFGTSGTVSTALIGQWSNVMLLESRQERVELYGQEWVSLGSEQQRVEVNLD